VNRISFLAIATVASLIISGCGNSGNATDNNSPTPAAAKALPPSGIKIGLVASQNGDEKPWGDDSVAGAQLAFQDFNDAGGLDGKSVELEIQDSASKAEVGKSAAEKLLSDGVICVLGEVASGITMQMINATSPKHVPLVAIGATKTTLCDGHDDVFRVCYKDDFQGPVMAKFAYSDLGLRSIALMTDKKLPYSTGLSKNFADYFVKLGGKIVDEQFYESGQTQFSGQLTEIKSKNPDGLFCSGYFPEVGPIARQASEAGLNVKLLGGDGWDSLQILTSGGKAIVGGFFCNHYNNKDDRKQVQDFLSKWNAKYHNTPGTTMGALGYDAAMLSLQALKNAKTKDAKGLTEALANTEGFEGVTGTITLKGMHGNPAKRALVVKVQEDGFAFAKAYEPKDIK
jgi:branched-chain amino acid transport system substrate-binding protein